MSVIAYFDESGDDGNVKYSSETFILTATYMHTSNWKENYDKLKEFRSSLKKIYNIPIQEEFHTAKFFTDKNPYREYSLSPEDRRKIVITYANVIASLNIKVINTIIDKENIINNDYPILSNALTYTIQRIENDSNWKYLIISDKGRVQIMKRTARLIRNYNPISSMFEPTSYKNSPIKNMIEDILEKDSKESYFIQVSDFISFIINVYYKYYIKGKPLPNRINNWLSLNDIKNLMNILKSVFNTHASTNNEYGLVIYPKPGKKNTTLPSSEVGVVR